MPDAEGSAGNRDWDEQVRGESRAEQMDRNWSDLLQELRVTQTGVQLLTGFLLTLPFQQKFDGLSSLQRSVYLATVAASLTATGLLVAPVALHRLMFRRRLRDRMVAEAHRLAVLGLALLALAIVGVAFLVFDVVAGRAAALVTGSLTAVLLLSLWAVLPLLSRRPRREPPPPGR